ncbi:Protein of unknown function (Porph_ging) [Belliella baltica DSM 15883]|uniref:GLPGLI family protein n=1 Tax=Belliella baltica (strain DSM 15883 / CIP 108006 / LMG 21964 / BA134) TaxID=866536 RepID=I3Z0T3_BELBD|nr:GLPGLI family protein [Belliella baltica]AFL82851.1 Protein of unknown function (Porph_ging) [Belliella baltica DSM 15883]
MSKILIILISFFASSELNQNYVSTHMVYYEVIFKSDSTNLDFVSSDLMVLFVGDKKSKFRNYYQMQRDSLVAAAKENGVANPGLILGQVNQIQKPKFKYTIVKDWKNKSYKYYDRIIPDNFVFEGTLVAEDWEILEEFDEYEGFKVQKAITTYGGRNFEAWFTTEIPINDGPYVFGNLPGLIVKLNDTKNHYSFNMVGISKMEESLDHNMNPVPIKTTRNKYFQLEADFNTNIFERLARAGITMTDPNQAKEVQNRYDQKNNPLEIQILRDSK